eukprot:jgi/Psemu1/22217/gm1.22217_g
MNACPMKRTGVFVLRKRHCSSAATNSGCILRDISATRISRCPPGRLFSSKRSKPTGKKPRVKMVSTPGGGGSGSGSVESVWYTSAGTRPALDMGRYGLKRLDYTHMKPPVWTAPPHPPTKTAAERVVFPLTLALAAGIVLWVYMSPEEDDMTEYWKRVESGQILLDDDDDDDYDDDDYDDEEEE